MYLEGELVCSLNELKKLRKNRLSLKEKMQDYEEENQNLKVSHNV